MNQKQMLEALKELDKALPQAVQLLIGGGAAFVLAHHIPLSTSDIDGIPYQSQLKQMDLDVYVKQVSDILKIPKDWLNPYFATFTYSLPKDYGSRLLTIFTGKKLKALALSKEDLLIMKCFAGREKDIPHASTLLKKKLNLSLVAQHLHYCIDERLPKAQEATDFFYDLCNQLGIDI